MIKAVLIDDEVHCLDTLAMQLAEHCPDVEILAQCRSAKAGLDAIATLHPAVVFLDIEMPHMS